jgi:molecular chaperone DnaK
MQAKQAAEEAGSANADAAGAAKPAGGQAAADDNVVDAEVKEVKKG